MATLRRVPTLVHIICLVAGLFVAAGIGAAIWFEAAEALRVEQGGEANMQVGLAYGFFGGIIPVFTLLAAGISSGILIARRTRARQDAGLIRQGWPKRTLTSLGFMLLEFAAVAVLVGLIWFGIDAAMQRAYGDLASESDMVRSLGTVLGLVFGPGMTGALPAILLTASAPGPNDEEVD
ncbi:MAG: hypothetical protein ACTHXA_13975 [Gulosibacter sp.]|uniref:hypothetical protein n=1 Tax=Gulosibacter sp. TaxID=2817531 RepID=UPI003F91E16D